MFTWLVRGLLAAAAVVAEWFVAPTSPEFSVVQGMISLIVFVVVVFILALWPSLRRSWRGWRGE